MVAAGGGHCSVQACKAARQLAQAGSFWPITEHQSPPRSQLRILQAVSGYSAEDDDSSAAASTAGAAGAAGAAGRGALEAALVAKSRQLEHKLTTLRLELAEARGGRVFALPCCWSKWG